MDVRELFRPPERDTRLQLQCLHLDNDLDVIVERVDAYISRIYFRYRATEKQAPLSALEAVHVICEDKTPLLPFHDNFFILSSATYNVFYQSREALCFRRGVILPRNGETDKATGLPKALFTAPLSTCGHNSSK